MLGTLAVREVEGRITKPAVATAETVDDAPAARAVAHVDALEHANPSRLRALGDPRVGQPSVTGAQLARAVESPEVAGLQSILGRYHVLAADLDDGTPAALMASGTDPMRALGEYATYLSGQRVDVPQAALLTTAGVERNADIGTALAAYRSYVRYDGVSPNAAAMLASAHVRTGFDIGVIYQRYRGLVDNGRSATAAAALATAELEGDTRDASLGLTQRLRNVGFHADDDAFVAAAMLRHGRRDPGAARAYDLDLRDRGVPPFERTTLVAAGVASGRSSTAMVAAYDWFLRHGGVRESEAAMLAAGWAMSGGDAAGVMTSLALRNRDMRD